MIGDMSILIDTFTSNENYICTRKTTGSIVKGTWTEGTPVIYTFKGVLQTVTPEMYSFYEGFKLTTDAKVLCVYANLKAIDEDDNIVSLTIQDDDMITANNTDYLVTGILKDSQETNIISIVLEKVVIK